MARTNSSPRRPRKVGSLKSQGPALARSAAREDLAKVAKVDLATVDPATVDPATAAAAPRSVPIAEAVVMRPRIVLKIRLVSEV